MKLTLRVAYADGSAVETEATTADLVEFEDHFDRSVTVLDDGLRLKHVTWLAWQSLTRQGKTTAEFRAWLQSIDSAEIVGAEASPPPLERTASTSG